MESARERTVRKRMDATRTEILDHARSIITSGGVSALTARSLAQSASVALSTLYSLVGKREDILAALFTQMQDRVRERIGKRGELSGLEMVEALANEVTTLYAEDENYYKAAYLAMEHLDETTMRSATVLEAYHWGNEMICAGIRQCAREGRLLGLVPVAMLGDFAVQSYRGAYRRWSCGQLTIKQVRVLTLAHSYIVLLADATPDFRKILDQHMAEISHYMAFDPIDSNTAYPVMVRN